MSAYTDISNANPLNLATQVAPMFAELYSWLGTMTFSDSAHPGAGDGGYWGFGAYYASGAWRNVTAGQGGTAIRNTSGNLDFIAGTNPGAAGSLLSNIQTCGRLAPDGRWLLGTYAANGGDWIGGAIVTATTDVSGGRAISAYHGYNGSGSAIAARVDFTSGHLADFFFGSGSYYGTSSVITVGSITTNGTSTAYNTSSDYRLKDGVADLSDSGSFIDALRPRTWTWKSNGQRGAGFIAHELAAVSPSSVHGEKDAVDGSGKPVYQAVEYGSAEVMAMLVAEVKDLRRRLAAHGIA